MQIPHIKPLKSSLRHFWISLKTTSPGRITEIRDADCGRPEVNFRSAHAQVREPARRPQVDDATLAILRRRTFCIQNTKPSSLVFSYFQMLNLSSIFLNVISLPLPRMLCI